MAIITEWGRNETDFAGVVHSDAVHHKPVYSLSGSFNTETGQFVGRIWKSDTGGGNFLGNSTFMLVWKLYRSDGTTHEEMLASYRGDQHGNGSTPLEINNTVNIAGFTKVELYMTCNVSGCEAFCGHAGNGHPTYNPMTGSPQLVSRGDIQLTQKPNIESVTNRSPYTSPNDGILHNDASSFEDKIQLNFTYSGSDATGLSVKINGNPDDNSFTYDLTNKTVEITGLAPGTSYQVQIQLSNGGGNSEWSNPITIRTKYQAPNLFVSHDHAAQAGLESITVSWTSNNNAQLVQYTIDGGSWITAASNIDAKSGSFTVIQKNDVDLYEGTTYRIVVRILSTSAYDTIYSANKSISCTTDAKAVLQSSSPTSLNIGDALRIIKTNESGNTNQIRLYLTTSDILWKSQNSPSNDYSISFSQAEWDTAYMKFLNPANPSISATGHNRINFKIRVVTIGRNREYTQDYTGYLNLTGKMLTTKTNVNGSIKRAQVWCNPDGSGPKRAVAWISTAQGTWRRGI